MRSALRWLPQLAGVGCLLRPLVDDRPAPLPPLRCGAWFERVHDSLRRLLCCALRPVIHPVHRVAAHINPPTIRVLHNLEPQPGAHPRMQTLPHDAAHPVDLTNKRSGRQR